MKILLGCVALLACAAAAAQSVALQGMLGANDQLVLERRY